MSTLSYFSSFGIGNFVSMGTRASVNRIVISIGFFLLLLYILLQWLVLTLFKLMFFKGARASQTVK